MTIVTGFFNGGDATNVTYTFYYQEDGLFEYEIENGEQDKEGVKNVLGSLFLRDPIGFCAWTDLPKGIKEDFAKKLTPVQLVKAQLVAKSAYCDGLLIIFSDKADWEELEFKAKLMNNERRQEL